MHGASMAIDIDAGKDPYIMHSAGAAALDAELKPVFHRIAEFILNDPMREYFRLMKDGTALTAFLAGPWLATHPGATAPPVAHIVHQMWEHYAALGGAIPTGGPPGVADFTKPPNRGRPFHRPAWPRRIPAPGS